MIAEAVTGAIGPLASLIDSLFTSDEERERAKLALLTEEGRQAIARLQAEMAPSLAQIDVNKIEAGSANVFVAGWRPAIGWTCAAGLAWSFVGQPAMTWAVAAFDLGLSVPVIPTDGLLELVLAMLGMGGLRTFEKLKGVAKG